MRILAIETSCDETAISIIEKRGGNFTALSNIISSQATLHAPFGGVVPNLAKREHEKNLVPILLTALKEAKLHKLKVPKADALRHSGTGKNQKSKIQVNIQNVLKKILIREPELWDQIEKKILPLKIPDIDAIAITYGPGLEPALWVGINFAKALAYIWKKPVIPVNHMEGHVYSSFIQKSKVPKADALRRFGTGKNQKNKFTIQKIRFPALALLVSGGHTELVLIKKLGSYNIIGETLDDAAGEAFDKVAQMLNLGYPGGPAISRLAEKGSISIAFPRPMIKSSNFNFSFSGLKTAVLYYLRDHSNIKKSDIAASFETAVVETLVAKTLRALKTYKTKTLLLGGGVAANKLLRQTLEDQVTNAKLCLPNTALTGDNALMIAVAAFFRKKKSARNIHADGNTRLQ